MLLWDRNNHTGDLNELWNLAFLLLIVVLNDQKGIVQETRCFDLLRFYSKLCRIKLRVAPQQNGRGDLTYKLYPKELSKNDLLSKVSVAKVPKVSSKGWIYNFWDFWIDWSFDPKLRNQGCALIYISPTWWLPEGEGPDGISPGIGPHDLCDWQVWI